MKIVFLLSILNLGSLLCLAQEIENSQDIDKEKHHITPYRVGIIVSDLDDATEWYKNVFDVELYRQFSYPDYYNMRVNLLKNDFVQFELVGRESIYNPEDLEGYDIKEKPIRGFYKITYEVNDINAFYKKLKEKNVEIYLELMTDEDLKIRVFNIKDPDGNYLQFVEEL